MKNLLCGVLLLALSITACSPSNIEIQATVQAAINNTQSAVATATQSTSYSEQEDLISFCLSFQNYENRRIEFNDAFDQWVTEIGDNLDPDRAHDFFDWSIELQKDVLMFERPPVARELHDLFLEYSGNKIDEMFSLELYNKNPNEQTYKEYTEKYQKNVIQYKHIMDAFNDLMNFKNIDPVSCERYP